VKRFVKDGAYQQIIEIQKRNGFRHQHNSNYMESIIKFHGGVNNLLKAWQEWEKKYGR